MNSMVFSIVERFPFLDYRLVEYAFSLPAAQKIRNGWTKWVLRQAMEGILPEEVRWKRGKWFISPEMVWLQQEREKIKELFSTGTLGGEFINSEYIVDNLLSQEKGHLPQLWRVINLELWLRAFFTGE
jgi:asparagine synthase (glutamine-hydrolysing)